MMPGSEASGGGPLPGVSLQGVWKLYGTAAVLRDVTLAAYPGRVLGLLGPNGAGKSTVLRVAAGVTRPTRGTVQVQGADPLRNGIRRAIGFAGHRSFLYGALTAEENLLLYAALYGATPPAAAEAIARFELGPARHHRVQELSRGFVQRVSLARAFLHDPAIVLLDEPFTGLDAGAAGIVAALLRDRRAEGRTIVFATHEWTTARELADDAVVLARGRVVHRGPARALAASDLPALFATPAS